MPFTAKPKAVCVLNFSWVVTSSSHMACANMWSIKLKVPNISLCHQATAINNQHKKFGEDRLNASGDIIADRHTSEHNTALPYWGQSNNNSVSSLTTRNCDYNWTLILLLLYLQLTITLAKKSHICERGRITKMLLSYSTDEEISWMLNYCSIVSIPFSGLTLLNAK